MARQLILSLALVKAGDDASNTIAQPFIYLKQFV